MHTLRQGRTDRRITGKGGRGGRQSQREGRRASSEEKERAASRTAEKSATQAERREAGQRYSQTSDAVLNSRQHIRLRQGPAPQHAHVVL